MRDLHFPGRSVVMSTGAMVSTSQPMATAVALDVLRGGGNAMDAAVAASATLAVTEPQSTGIGGDCFLLYHEASSGQLHGLNGSGRAPAAATLDRYRAKGYTEVPAQGLYAATVPGALHAWETAIERFGTKSLDELLQPAIGYAKNGFAVTPVIADNWLKGRDLLAAYEDSKRVYLRDGEALRAGDVHRHPELAATLETVAKEGAKAFYQGPIAERIVKFSEANDGLFSLDDFAEHRTDWVKPVSSDYRGYRVFELPPNGQGITALMMLNIVEQAAISELTPFGADHVHLFAEAYKLSLAERDRFVADPEFNELPVEALISKEFGIEQWRRIDPENALEPPVASGYRPGKDTVYLSVVDADRNMVSFINSVCYGWGCGVLAGDTGVLLQNRGVCFSLEDGHLNCIEPRKRSMHTIIPAMVYKDEKPVLCYGVMGGHYQPMGHAYVLSNWVDLEMDLQEAVDAPRFLPVGDSLVVERGIAADTLDELARRGHKLESADGPHGGGQCIYVDWERGVLQAASEPRKDGCALGY
jgi:gamma-glutamyltranspeptidase/glutathione hydrolase